ncbi:DUF2336 domain-containing protein [Kaistia geumhonensis]|uniref:DUF2336 domain-containing protein n=1 Tax=Kaistia geumhonensis TaxID=410839 RepID=A0ABU0M3R9_9HYPH|nr:DUF2336 domain-containing protein [Kaistia geumhonensis]MCX5479195.1 DUF2336 domain-containing protein [Kaistia geumhonensis]MDQ0515585.1 hypothetical protein [Kaistia geumhonensis]
MAVSNQQSRDAALLRATTELFVLEANHDADAIRRFEELATHFLARVPAADRAFVAERLSRSADAPASVLRLLGKDVPEVASPVLKRSPALGEFDLLTIIAGTGAPHHRLIATRGDLSALVVGALRLTGDAEVIARLSGYPDVVTETDDTPAEPVAAADMLELPAEQPAFLAPAAEDEPDRILGSHEAVPAAAAEVPADEAATAQSAPIAPDPTSEDEPEFRDPAPGPEAMEIFAAVRALATSFEEIAGDKAGRASRRHLADPLPASAGAFLDLDRAGRLAVLNHLAGRPASSRGAGSVLDADHAFRLALGRARLASLARQRQRDALIRTLAQGLRLEEADVTALLDDPSGEPLVVLLRGIGLSESEAQQVLMFANPVIAQGVESFDRLARLLSETPESVAADLLALWRTGEMPRSKPMEGAASGHQPVFADLEIRRGIHSGDARSAPLSPSGLSDPPERSTFGLRRG